MLSKKSDDESDDVFLGMFEFVLKKFNDVINFEQVF